MSCCSSYIALHFQSLQLVRLTTDGKPLIKTKLNRLINSVCFRLRSITKKENHGNYSVKACSEKYSTWYMKVHIEEYNTGCTEVVWKIQYKFGNTTIH